MQATGGPEPGDGADERSDSGRPPGSRTSPNRRSILRAVGAGFVTPALAGGPTWRRPGLGRDGDAPPFADVAGEADVRPVPVRGGCDAAVGNSSCGDSTVGLYGLGGSVGLGKHTYQFTLQGVPWNAFAGDLAPGTYAMYSGAEVTRIPPPPSSAGPNWGPYQLMFHGSNLSLDVLEDLAAPVRRIPGRCHVPQSCQERWCGNVDRTIAGLRESSRVLHTELLELQSELAGKVFFVSVRSKALEPAMRTLLAGKITNYLQPRLASIRAAVAGTPQPDLDGGTCENCPTCVQLPRLRRVRDWELRLFERSAATASLDGLQAWSRHELRATVLLEPARLVGPRHLGELLGGSLGRSAGSLLGTLGGMGSSLGRVFGGTSNRRSWSGQPRSVTAWENDGHVTETEHGVRTVINRVGGTRTDFAADADFATLDIHFDDDEYELAFPQVSLTGSTVTTGYPQGGVSTSPLERRVGYGDRIARRARAGGSGGPVSAAEARDNPVRFSLADSKQCGSQLGNTVELALDGDGLVGGTYSHMLGEATATDADATLHGSASVEWELVPNSFENVDLHAVRCQ